MTSALTELDPAQTGASVIVNVLGDAADADGCTVTDCTLREAIAAANANVTTPSVAITFSPTVFASRQTITLAGTSIPAITRSLIIVAPTAGLTINSAGVATALSVSSGTVSFSGLTLNSNSSQTGITNSGALTVQGCTINSYNNGLVSNAGSLTISTSTISGSTGFGLSVNAGTVLVQRSTFSGNNGASGGAIRTLGGATSMENTTLANNRDGISAQAGTVDILASTIALNTRGVAISAGVTASLRYSLIAGNTNANTGSFSSTARSINGVSLATAGLQGTLQNNGGPTQTIALVAGGLAVDYVGNAGLSTGLATDQRGISRPQAGGDDAGAYELIDPAQSGPAYVVNTPVDSDDGTCGTSECTLREAINAANSDGVNSSITFSLSNFAGPTIDLDGASLPAILNNGTLSISGPGYAVPIDGSNLFRVFQINSGAVVTMTGLTIRDGSTSGNGGGILNGGTLTLVGCTLYSNRTTGDYSIGGGISNAANASLTVRASLIRDNTTGTFGKGGGIANEGTLTVENSTLGRNTATFAGALYNTGSPTGAVSLDSVTIANNTGSDGGGILNDSATPVVLTNTLISGNTDGGGPDRSQIGGSFSGGFNLVSIGQGSSGLTNGAGGNQIGSAASPINPLLGSLTDNGGPTETYALTIPSPAINAGQTALTVDQRGTSRPQGGRDDVGAFESTALVGSLVVTILTDEDNGTSDARFGAGTSLREAIDYANADGVNSAVTFSSTAFAAPRKTITLGTELPTVLLNGTLSVTAPAAGLVISGNSVARIIAIESGANVTFSGFNFSNATTSGNGGAFLNRGTLTLSTCLLNNNRAANGGAIYNDSNATLTLGSSTLRDNVATNSVNYGGAIHNKGTLTVRNSSFGGNTAFYGAAIYNTSSPTGAVSLDSVSIADNTGTDCGGILNDASAAVSLTNTLIARNVNSGGGTNRSQIAGTFSGGFNLLSIGDGSSGLTNGNNNRIGSGTTPIDAKIGTLADNGGATPTFLPQQGSPVLNAGDTTLSVDQRGTARPQNGRADIGAVEQLFSTNESLVVTTLTDEDNGTSDPIFGVGSSLREVIRFANSSADASTITFAPALFAGGATSIIQLQSALPNITSSVTLSGPGAKTLTLRRDTGGSYSVLTIDSDTAAVNVSGLTLANGDAGRGGGIFSKGARLTLTDCAIVGNDAGSGGGIFGEQGRLRLVNCTLSGNTAYYGAGLAFTSDEAQSLTLQNCTFSGNAAEGYGGGLYIRSDSASIQNCTITGNSAGNSLWGGGISSNGDVGAIVNNSIVAGNTITGNISDDVRGTFQSGGHNLIGVGTTTAFTKAGDRIGITDPLLGALSDNGGPTQTRKPQSNSLTVDAGDSTLATDQIGTSRPQGAGDDIGAFEVVPSGASSIVVNSTTNITNDDDIITLREAITAANARSSADATAYTVISFDPSVFATRKFINPTLSLPTIAGNVSLIGPAAGVEVRFRNVPNGFLIDSGRVSVSQLLITGATAAAIDNSGTLTVERCALSGNTGAGLINETGTLTVINSTIAQNGNGVTTKTGAATSIYSSTIAGNTSNGITASGTTNVFNSIIAGNGTNVSGTLTTNTNNLIGTLSEAGLQTASGAPVLAENGGPTPTIALVRGSAAIDTGGTDVSTDQRNTARPGGAAEDKGAFELQFNVSFVVTTLSDENNATSDPTYGTGTSLREAINDATLNGAGLDAITFSPSVFNTRQTITFTGGPPTITGDLSITAPASGVIIQGPSFTSLLTISSGTVTVSGLTFVVESGTFAINNQGGTLTARNCLFTGTGSNQTTRLQNDGAFATMTLQNCTVTGSTNATAVVNFGGTMTVQGCSITGNIFGLSNIDGGTLFLSNSIVAGNTSTDIGGEALALDDHNLKNMTATQAGLDPAGLQPNGGQSNTVALVAGSPAIDAGSNARIPNGTTTDQRGVGYPRIAGSAVDIGAYEFVTTAVRLISFQAQKLSDGVSLSWRTGWESNNLGFHIYRQVKRGGKWQRAVRLNPALIAGSALLNGQNADPRGGFAYNWDDTAATPSALARLRGVRYWLQDVDVKGKTVNHGPVVPSPGSGGLSGRRNSKLVSELNR